MADSPKADSKINAGQRIEPPAKGKIAQWLFKTFGLRTIISVVNAVLNLQFKFQFDPGNGGIPISKDAQVTFSDGKLVVVSPLIPTGSSSISSDGHFEGAGPPAAGTLAAQNYFAAPNPDFYVDTTAKNLYYCSTAGTNATSVWIKISGGGGGLNPRGLWSATPPTPYMTFDFVVVQQGASAGAYYSTIDNNGNNPATGIGWVQFATGNLVAAGYWA
jgi:hypothetical protein